MYHPFPMPDDHAFVRVDEDIVAIRFRVACMLNRKQSHVEKLDWSWMDEFLGRVCRREVLVEAIRWTLTQRAWDLRAYAPECIVCAMDSPYDGSGGT